MTPHSAPQPPNKKLINPINDQHPATKDRLHTLTGQKMSAATHMGSYRYNQDRVIATPTFLAVADGHGPQPYGERIAEWTREFLLVPEHQTLSFPELFDRLEKHIHSQFRTLLRTKPFIEIDGAFYDPYSLSAYRGGTTLTVVRIDPDTHAISAAHAGDSDARYYDFPLVSEEATETGPKELTATADPTAAGPKETEAEAGVSLTPADHSPTSIDEYRAVMSRYEARATVAPGVRLHAPEFIFESPYNPRLRPPVFVKSTETNDLILNPSGGLSYATVRGDWGAYVAAGGECLAMTRAIGDFNLKRYGLTHEPSVHDVEPPPANTRRVIIAASDGLWDVCQYAEVGEVVRAHLSAGPKAVADALVALAIVLSIKRFGDPNDNISVAVTFIDQT
jgi:serine/threonine protein phosphatase PrpC